MDSAETDRLTRVTRAALHELIASLGSYLQRALQLLVAHVGRNAVHVIIIIVERSHE